MKKIGRTMNLLMALTMSLFLSFTGTFTSGNFTVPGFFISFLIGTIISLLIGLLVPIKPISDAVCSKCNLQPRTLGRRFMESFVADIIFTPVMTLLMVTLAYFMLTKQGGHPPFVPMFLKSFVISMIVGFILAYIFQPLFLRLLLKKYGVPAGGPENGGTSNADQPER